MSTAVSTLHNALSPTVVNAQSLFSAIVRAVEAGADPEKSERMFALFERVKASEAKSAWISAMAAAQPELPSIVKTATNKGTGSKYALWEDTNRAITPVLSRHGLTLTFRTAALDAKSMTITAVVSHVGGHSEETSVPQPVESINRAMNGNQAVQSAISYGKRSAAGAILNLTFIGEDDDGNAAGAQAGIVTQAQAEELGRLVEEANVEAIRFMDHFKADSFASFPAKRFEEARNMLTKRIAANREAK